MFVRARVSVMVLVLKEYLYYRRRDFLWNALWHLAVCKWQMADVGTQPSVFSRRVRGSTPTRLYDDERVYRVR